MAKYKLKPMYVEAVQFNGFDKHGQVNLSERPDWLVNEFGTTVLFFQTPNTLTVMGIDGKMFAFVGDYIVRGVNGELFVYDSDTFHMMYERHLVWDENI